MGEDMIASSDVWRVVAASVRGTSHTKTGQPCQDAHQWRVLPGGAVVVAVADGAGSAAMGDIGATIAARTIVEAVYARITMVRLPEDDAGWRVFLTNVLRAAQMAVEAEAAKQAVTAQDLATTLIL